MIGWLKEMASRFRRRGAPRAAARPGTGPHTAMPGTAVPPGAVGGVERLTLTNLDGRPVDPLLRVHQGIVFENGLVIEVAGRGHLTIGDGSVVSSLEGLGTCDVCRVRISRAIEASQADLLVARYGWLHHRERLAITESGLSACPAHRRLVASPEGPRLVTTLELEQQQLENQLQLPLRLALRMILDDRR